VVEGVEGVAAVDLELEAVVRSLVRPTPIRFFAGILSETSHL
jgi:hypothetical protein